MSKLSLTWFVVVSGCNAGSFLDGVGFEVRDAVFERAMVFDGSTQVTKILVSDAVEVCGRETLAGHSELSIMRWESGTVQVALRTYDSNCEVIETELASQGWVDDQSNDPYHADFDVVFRTETRSVSGRLNADFCALPENARIGCN